MDCMEQNVYCIVFKFQFYIRKPQVAFRVGKTSCNTHSKFVRVVITASSVFSCAFVHFHNRRKSEPLELQRGNDDILSTKLKKSGSE